jgi:hypothetical protein
MKYLYLLIFSILFINNNAAQENNAFPKFTEVFHVQDFTDLEFELMYIGKYHKKISKKTAIYNQHSGVKWENYYFQNSEKKIIGLEIDFDFNQLRTNNQFPVLLKNPTKDTLLIGFGYHLSLTVEALDTNGLWIPLIEKGFLFCGTGLYPIVLTPNTIALTFYQLNNEGDYSTELRFKLGDNYSETFRNKIFLNQLDYYSDE